MRGELLLCLLPSASVSVFPAIRVTWRCQVVSTWCNPALFRRCRSTWKSPNPTRLTARPGTMEGSTLVTRILKPIGPWFEPTYHPD